MRMLPLHALPLPELGLDLVRDVVDIRRLPRWDPRYWGHVALEDEPRCDAKFRALGLSWATARAQTRARAEAAKLGPKHLPHQRDGERELAHDQLSLEPKHAVARARERAVTPLVGAASAGVIAAVDFNHEVSGGRAKIYDEVSEHHLPFETDAELATPWVSFTHRPAREVHVSMTLNANVQLFIACRD